MWGTGNQDANRSPGWPEFPYEGRVTLGTGIRQQKSEEWRWQPDFAIPKRGGRPFMKTKTHEVSTSDIKPMRQRIQAYATGNRSVSDSSGKFPSVRPTPAITFPNPDLTACQSQPTFASRNRGEGTHLSISYLFAVDASVNVLSCLEGAISWHHQAAEVHDKGKPSVMVGRKAMGPGPEDRQATERTVVHLNLAVALVRLARPAGPANAPAAIPLSHSTRHVSHALLR
jgi:hypothetical protein